MIDGNHPGSFRDPSGLVFYRAGTLLRRVHSSYREHYEFFTRSGLYETLTHKNFLIPHAEIPKSAEDPPETYKILRPENVKFISYPYEWCFGQMKAAALTTLEIQKEALGHGMTLKDASAYNIQFHNGRAILIDTLSFEKFNERPWVAYRQFCRHFLAPLALMSEVDARLGLLMRNYLDGIPLDLAVSLLPTWKRWRPDYLIHLKLHAQAEKLWVRRVDRSPAPFSVHKLKAIVDNLENITKRLKPRFQVTPWTHYRSTMIYSERALASKEKAVLSYLDRLDSADVWDLGANDGRFSRLASHRGIRTIAWDADVSAVQALYEKSLDESDKSLLPLVLDVANPSPSMGWNGVERSSFFDRGPADTVLALALIHHLVYRDQASLPHLALFFSKICRHLVIEFVPSDDPSCVETYPFRDRCHTLDRASFEMAFGEFFELNDRRALEDSARLMYLWTIKEKLN